MVMSQFTPDTFTIPINPEDNGHGEDFSLWRHYAGVIKTPYVVIIKSGVATPAPGTVSPTVHDIKGNAEVPNATASYTGADAGSGDAGLAVFTGGRTYTVTAAEETILLAAGYTMDA
jgi:hypothetical protein